MRYHPALVTVVAGAAAVAISSPATAVAAPAAAMAGPTAAMAGPAAGGAPQDGLALHSQAPGPRHSGTALARSCQVILPTGDRFRISVDAAGHQRVAAIGASASGSRHFESIQAAGHVYVLPDAAMPALLAGKASLASYDATDLAAGRCGGSVATGNGPNVAGGYRLARLTVRTLDSAGAKTNALVILVNVDTAKIGGEFVTTDQGVAKVAVPAGHWAALTLMSSNTPSGTAYQFVTAPQVTVTDGTVITLDARKATLNIPVPATPQPADFQSSDVAIGRGPGTVSTFSDTLGTWAGGGAPTPVTVNATAPVTLGTLGFEAFFDYTSPAGTTSPYSYEISEPGFNRIPTSFPAAVNPASLARLDTSYYSQTPDRAEQEIGYSIPQGLNGSSRATIPFTAPLQRAEYVTADPRIAWSKSIIGDMYGSYNEMMDSFRSYRPGQRVEISYGHEPQHPGVELDTAHRGIVCPACRSGDSLQFEIWPFSDNVPGRYGFPDYPSNPNFTETQAYRLYRDGTLVGSAAGGLQGLSLPVSADPATYRLVYDVTRQDIDFPLSTSSHTAWTFGSSHQSGNGVPADWKCIDLTRDCAPLPLLYAYYTADSDLLNQLAPGTHTLSVAVQHQENSVAPAISRASVAVSYNDGASWTKAPVTGGNGSYRATFTVPDASQTNGFVAVRVSASDSAGNGIEQTVLRAYAIP
jgi:hypothetical protein